MPAANWVTSPPASGDGRVEPLCLAARGGHSRVLGSSARCLPWVPAWTRGEYVLCSETNLKKFYLKPMVPLPGRGPTPLFLNSAHSDLCWHASKCGAETEQRPQGFTHKTKIKWKCLSWGCRGHDLLWLFWVSASIASQWCFLREPLSALSHPLVLPYVRMQFRKKVSFTLTFGTGGLVAGAGNEVLQLLVPLVAAVWMPEHGS